MARFVSGRNANVFAFNVGASAMHVIRYFETGKDEPCEITEYWVKHRIQDQSEFNKRMWEFMSEIGMYGNLLSYQRIDFD